MKKLFVIIVLVIGLTPAFYSMAQEFTMITPNELQTGSFTIHGVGDEAATFGKVSFRIDMAAERDNLFELAIRRENLTLPDGRPVTSFGYDQTGGLIVGGVAPIDQISVAGVTTGNGGKQALVLFHDENNDVIAPDQNDIAVFDLDYSRLPVSYRPLVQSTNLGMDVSILIDSSGSMAGFMPDAIEATKIFLASLPAFTGCQIMTFNSAVTHLTPVDPSSLMSCPDSQQFLNNDIVPEGNTALLTALEEGFAGNQYFSPGSSTTIPKLVIVVTDGVNNIPTALSHDELLELKNANNVKTFVFWVGNYEAEHLLGLADYEVAPTAKVKQELEQFLQTIGVSVSGIQTLQVQ